MFAVGQYQFTGPVTMSQSVAPLKRPPVGRAKERSSEPVDQSAGPTHLDLHPAVIECFSGCPGGTYPVKQRVEDRAPLVLRSIRYVRLGKDVAALQPEGNRHTPAAAKRKGRKVLASAA
jgi:hypothetical protein